MQFTVELPEYCNFPDPESCLALIRQVGFLRLAGPDGCSCGHLSLGGIDVDVSCYKSSAEVKVNARDASRSDLEAIGSEVMHQVCDVEDPDVTAYRRSRYKLIVTRDP